MCSICKSFQPLLDQLGLGSAWPGYKFFMDWYRTWHLLTPALINVIVIKCLCVFNLLMVIGCIVLHSVICMYLYLVKMVRAWYLNEDEVVKDQKNPGYTDHVVSLDQLKAIGVEYFKVCFDYINISKVSKNLIWFYFVVWGSGFFFWS